MNSQSSADDETERLAAIRVIVAMVNLSDRRNIRRAVDLVITAREISRTFTRSEPSSIQDPVVLHVADNLAATGFRVPGVRRPVY